MQFVGLFILECCSLFSPGITPRIYVLALSQPTGSIQGCLPAPPSYPLRPDWLFRYRLAWGPVLSADNSMLHKGSLIFFGTTSLYFSTTLHQPERLTQNQLLLKHVGAHAHIWHSSVTFVLPLPPPNSCPCLFAVGHLPQSRDGWAVRVIFSVKPGCVTPHPASAFVLIHQGALVLHSANQPQQRSGGRHWRQGGMGSPQIATSRCYMTWYLCPVE